MAKEYKTYEEASEARDKAKITVKQAKEQLTDYYTKNKLKRNIDYTSDKKHGEPILKLQSKIDQATEQLENINLILTKMGTKSKSNDAKAEKGKATKSAGREAKYDYPADCDTAEKKKKYRIEQRRKAAGKTEKPAKTEKASKSKAESTDTKATDKKSKKATPSTEVSSKKSSKGKVDAAPAKDKKKKKFKKREED